MTPGQKKYLNLLFVKYLGPNSLIVIFAQFLTFVAMFPSRAKDIPLRSSGFAVASPGCLGTEFGNHG